MLRLRLDEGSGAGPPILLVEEEQPAVGEGEAGTGHTEGAPAHETGGMPQLDPADFAPQIVWLAIAFSVLYYLVTRVALPRIAEVLDEREQRIEGDLDKAEKLKAEADEAQATYQKTLADARARAQDELRKVAVTVAAETAERDNAFSARLSERTRAAEEGIAAAKARAAAELRAVAAEAVGTILDKIAGVDVPAADRRAAVDAMHGERG
jgi:F-type H+-transporting ATPase subunit b